MNKRIFSLFLISLFIYACGSSNGSLRQIPRSQRKGLVVLNFMNNTPKSRASEYQPWEFGIASMIMTDIEAIGMFNIVSKERLKDIIKEQEYQLTGLVDPANITQLGKLVGANFILTGSFMEMNGTLRLETQVFSVEKGSQLGTASITGKTDGFFSLEKELVVKTARYLDTILTENEQKAIASRVETKSVEASLSNYRGELAALKADELKKKGRAEEAKKAITEARVSFEKAIEADPNYSKARENLSKVSLAIPVNL